MKKTIHSIKALLLSGLLAVGYSGSAQQYPFPQDTDYPFGYKPSGVTSTPATAAYTAWKNAYLVDGPTCAGSGTKRVKFDAVSGRFGISGDNSIATVSEGIAYGMLMSAYYGEKNNFDALWNYYKKFVNSNGIMNWGVNNTSCTIIGQNGATDAELDVAWALYVAHYQFGNGTTSTYLTGAKQLIGAIKSFEVDKSGGLNTLKPGDQFGGHGSGNNNLVNVSYFSPMYYRVFGEITNDAAFWESVYNRGYDIMEKAMNKNTGLVPDWCTSTGTVPASGAAQYDDGGVNFFYDAVRTPVRVALDYLWYGDQSPRALAYTKTVNNWLRGKHPNPADIGSKYSLTGDKLQVFHNNTFVGAFAVSAMATDDATTRAYITSLYNENVKVAPGTGEYFNASWKVLSLFILSGNFYLPPPDACDGPFLEQATHLCQGTGTPKAITLDCSLPGASKYEWKKDGVVISGATQQTYTVNSPGNYEVSTTVTVNGKACVRRTGTIVYPATPVAKFTFTRNGLAVDFKNTSTGGDPFADPATLTSLWKFDNQGTSANPATSTTANGATNYSTSGLKIVSLTVTNVCNVSNTYSEQLPLPTAAGPGWVGTDFTTSSQGLFSAYTGAGVVNPNVTIDNSNCQYATASVKKAMGMNETVALTFKSDTSALLDKNSPFDVTAYPYARFRIKIVTNADVTKLLPNGLRVDLVSWNDAGTPTVGTDDKFYATGGTAANVVYLKGPRNADGSYQPIPTNQWFVSTLSFEGKLTTPNFDKTKVLQLAFTPYNDLAANSTDRVDYQILIDWATVGNKDIAKPNPAISSGTVYVCSTNPVYPIAGLDLDSCNAESVLWSDGYTKFARNLGPGTYTVTVSNFAGSATRTITVGSIEPVNVSVAYDVLSIATPQLQPYGSSTGPVSRWTWHRATSSTATLSPSTTTGYNATTSTILYPVSTTASVQVPAPTPTSGRPTTAIFKGIASEYLCLVATPTVSGCAGTTRACVLVNWVLTSTEDALSESTFAVYPTVVTDNKVTVQLGTALQGTYDVKVMNINGVQVASSTASAGNKEITLPSDLTNGSYIVKVSQGDKTITKKFIKQ